MVFDPGDKVRHPFAGEGVIEKVDRYTVWVKWKKGGRGGANRSDLIIIQKKEPARGK